MLATLLQKSVLELGVLIIIVSACICGVSWFLIKFLKSSIRLSKRGMIISENENQRISSIAIFADYNEFCQILRELSLNIKNYFRAWCLENGLECMTDDKWAIYKKNKLEFIGKTAVKFARENYAHLSTDTMAELMIRLNSGEGNAMQTATAALLDDLRRIAVDQYAMLNRKKKELEEYMGQEEHKLRTNTAASVIDTLLSVGRRMVEIHEMQNRELVKKQMTKVEEVLLNVYNTLTVMYLEVASDLAKDKKGE